jgi:hypothetical protein
VVRERSDITRKRRLIVWARDKWDRRWEKGGRWGRAACWTPPPASDWTGWDFTTDVGWNPADVYSYKAFTTPQAVKNHALQFAGPGVLTVKQ